MQNFIRQFYDKHIWWAFAGLLFTHLIAALVQGTVWAWIPLVLIGVATAAVSYHKLEWGLAIAFLELFVGGHGHLIDISVAGFSLSIRQIIFAAVMGMWVVLLLSKRARPVFIAHRDLPLAMIGLAILIGAIKGFATNNLGLAFDDMNGYLTLLYFFPMISVVWDMDKRRLLLQTLGVAAVWIALTTLVYVYAFTHLPGMASHELYTFVRDTRLAEVTLQTAGPVIDLLGPAPWYFRVFQQSQLIVAAFELLLIAASLFLWRERQEKLPVFLVGLHGLMLATLFASLSRSLWIGCVAGFATVLAFIMLSRPNAVTLIKRHAQMAGYAVLALVALFVLIAVPLPKRPDLSDSSFYKGPDEGGREVAVSSRWNLLRPMVDEIWSDPIIGSGFGETVTFISDDPRLRAVDPTGEVTTYRFEWGYHDLWLKMGILGLLSFGWLFVTSLSVALEAVIRKDTQHWVVVGLGAALVMLYVTHIFSPFLNHPLGLGLIIFILPFFPWEEQPKVQDEVKQPVRPRLAIGKPTIGIAFKR